MSSTTDPYQRLREMEDNAFVERVVRYLDGEMSVDEFDAFSLELMHDANKRDAFVALTSLVQCVQRIERSGAIAEDAVVESLLGEDIEEEGFDMGQGYELADPVETCPAMSPGHLAPIEEEEEKDDPKLLFRLAGFQIYQSQYGLRPRHLAIAAMIMIAITLGVLNVSVFRSMVSPDQPQAIARLIDTTNLIWAEEQTPPADGQELTTGLLKAQSGFVEVVLDRGARVIFEAPFEAHLEDNNTLTLSSGKLVAHVPTEAYRFTVNTPTAKIVDLGTEFGVEVKPDGSTRTTVFQGKVEMYEVPEPGKVGRHTTLTAGLQSHVDEHAMLSPEVEQVPARPTFVRQFGETGHHVSVMRGNAKYQSWAPASVDRFDGGMLNHEPVIFVERESVTIYQRLTGVMHTEPGQYRGSSLVRNTGVFSSNHEVTSYMIHLDRPGPDADPTATPDSFATNAFTLRFPRPIVGIISQTEALDTTDMLFGHPEMNLPTGSRAYRGLDLGNSVRSSDAFELSDDRRTLKVLLSTSSTDQIRVLTEAEPDPLEVP